MKQTDGLKIDKRRKQILAMLERDGQVVVKTLSEELGATPVTIRSDLSALEKDGYLKRVTGGAVQTVRTFFNMDFQQRKQYNIGEKLAIAKLVPRLVKDGETLFINPGTTTLYAGMELKRRKSLNVVTNFMPLSVELATFPTFRVILLGGEVNAQYSFAYGSDALEQLSRYRATTAILSVDGISMEAGLTTYHAEEAEVCRQMIKRAAKTIIVADSTKFGHENFSKICGIERVDIFITGKNADVETVRALEKMGKAVMIAK